MLAFLMGPVQSTTLAGAKSTWSLIRMRPLSAVVNSEILNIKGILREDLFKNTSVIHPTETLFSFIWNGVWPLVFSIIPPSDLNMQPQIKIIDLVQLPFFRYEGGKGISPRTHSLEELTFYPQLFPLYQVNKLKSPLSVSEAAFLALD